VDTQGVEWHPEFVAANDDDGLSYTVWFDVPVEQTYSIDVRAVRVARLDVGQEDPYWQFIGPAPDIVVPNWVTVNVLVSQVTAGEVTLALSPAVADLSEEHIEVALAQDGSSVSAAIYTADNGATYTLSAEYTPGNTYAIRIEKPGYRFGEPLAFSIGTSPFLTGAWTNAEGTAVVLRFNKDMAEPSDTPGGFTLTEDDIPQPIQDVTRNPEDTRQLRLHLEQALNEGDLTLSYAPGVEASTDAGPLEAIETVSVANQNTVLGTAFALALQEQTVAEVATKLVTRFALDADGLLEPLLAIGYGPFPRLKRSGRRSLRRGL